MEKQEIIRYSANQVRQSPELFAEFLRLYEIEFGVKPNCAGCAFSSTFSKWKKSFNKIIQMKKHDNTFKLNPKYTQLYVPGNGEVITSNSEDSLVIEFLTQEDGKYFESRKLTFFEELPEGLTEEGEILEIESSEEFSIRINALIDSYYEENSARIQELTLDDLETFEISDLDTGEFGDLITVYNDNKILLESEFVAVKSNLKSQEENRLEEAAAREAEAAKQQEEERIAAAKQLEIEEEERKAEEERLAEESKKSEDQTKEVKAVEEPSTELKVVKPKKSTKNTNVKKK
ncbi:hypothetical protein [Aquimarina algiphila]|uniref:Uncharacterized protein n=1 Tax=Aquimarina algiphila TaxID=2047982 RepID=A0A554VE64_9FLAO|nr:hypothetical protein [Aquimarina algiphila]TSE05255.1 hypothetical protein FOF46_23620 [Aquimarina algiphila]